MYKLSKIEMLNGQESGHQDQVGKQVQPLILAPGYPGLLMCPEEDETIRTEILEDMDVRGDKVILFTQDSIWEMKRDGCA